MAETPWWGAVHVAIAIGFVLCVLGGLLVLVAGGLLMQQWPGALFWGALTVSMIFFTEVNVLGLMDLTQRLLPAMLARRHGHIVNHASMAYVGMPTHSTYGAAKAAIVALSDALRRELRGTGVRVTCLLTPMVATEMARTTFEGTTRRADFRLRLPAEKRWLSAQKYAERVFRALERAPAYYTTREGHLIVGLQRHAPWLLDHLVAKLFTRKLTNELGTKPE